MSYGPTTPSPAELLHHVVATALSLGGWQYVDGTEGGSSLAEWPAPGEAPPSLLAGDVAVLAPPVATENGCTDVVVFRLAADVDVDLVRATGGVDPCWDTGTHAPLAGSSVISAGTLTAASPGDFGDLVAVSRYGVLLAQITSTGTFGGLQYWGYLLSAGRNVDGTGEEVGESALPFPFGYAQLDPAGGPSGAPDFTFFAEGDVAVTGSITEYPPTVGPTRSGNDRPTIPLRAMCVAGDPLSGVREYTHGWIPYLFSSESGALGCTLSQVRDPAEGRWYLILGAPAYLAMGPLAPDASVRYRILTYGGPAVP